jgi:2-polyprenyl-6-methoxyphenol hydroxylase-like FAD-dependent oxidoreductase
MADIERILIVGGGIAGLSAAAALSRQGFSAELVERSATWPTIGAGINLPANGVRVLQALGLRAAAERNAAVVRRWGFFDQHGAALCETDLEDLWSEVGPSLAMTRVKLHEVLLAGAAAASRRLGVSLTALAQDDHRVRASFSDGASGDYDLVIGADGIHSTARRLVVGTYSPSYAGQLVWRSVVATRPQGIVDNIMVLMGEGRFFGLVPIGEGHTYGFGALNAESSEDPLEGRLERFRRRFAEFATPVSAYLGTIENDQQLHFGPIEWVEVDAWHRGRTVLIGDAAHAGPPHMGEGGCIAMEDSLVLAEELRNAKGVESALESYVRRRRPRADWVQAQSRAAAQAWVLPPAARNAALRERGDQMFRDRYRPLVPAP